MFAFRRLMLLVTVTTVALLTGAGAASAVVAPAAAEASPWPQSDGDAAHSRSNSSEHLLSQSTLPRVQPLRHIIAPSRPRGSICSSSGALHPVLTGGRVYGVFDARLAAYQASTGRRLWQGPTDLSRTTAYTSVSVSGSLVVAGSEYCQSMSDPSGSVDALRASTGQPVWSTPARDFTGVFDTVVAGNTVLAYENGEREYVEAFDLSTGRSLWSAERCDYEYERGALVVGGLAVYDACTGTGQTLVGVALRTGKTVWQQVGGDSNLFAGDQAGTSARHLYVNNEGDNAVTDLNPATGAVQGRLAGATGVLAVAGTRVFTTCAAGICAYVENSRTLSWSHASSATLAAAANGVLYLSDGTAVNAYSGQTLRTLFTGPATSLAVGDGRIAEVTSSAPKTLQLLGPPGL